MAVWRKWKRRRCWIKTAVVSKNNSPCLSLRKHRCLSSCPRVEKCVKKKKTTTTGFSYLTEPKTHGEDEKGRSWRSVITHALRKNRSNQSISSSHATIRSRWSMSFTPEEKEKDTERLRALVSPCLLVYARRNAKK